MDQLEELHLPIPTYQLVFSAVERSLPLLWAAISDEHLDLDLHGLYDYVGNANPYEPSSFRHHGTCGSHMFDIVLVVEHWAGFVVCM